MLAVLREVPFPAAPLDDQIDKPKRAKLSAQ
jgi:hypothetical protein